jgi:ubiquinone/menaquinone biosynthesis C-methylase UbiE
VARYDGLADWYDEQLADRHEPFTRLVEETVVELLGPGKGRCLDLGCGTGRYLGPLTKLGWTVTGLDESPDQLRVAAERAVGVELVEGDATALPFEDSTFEAVAALMVSTDIERYEAAIAEAARVLRPGGRFVHLGSHPCFVGFFSRQETDGTRSVFPGYFERGLTSEGPGIGEGIRHRVGVYHIPLAELLNGLAAAGLSLERVVERGDDPPVILGIAARA